MKRVSPPHATRGGELSVRGAHCHDLRATYIFALSIYFYQLPQESGLGSGRIVADTSPIVIWITWNFSHRRSEKHQHKRGFSFIRQQQFRGPGGIAELCSPVERVDLWRLHMGTLHMR